MSIKKNFNQQFQLRNFRLYHDVTSDFNLTCFQRNQSTIPLLFVRALIFVGCLCIWVASMVLTADTMELKYWPIYLTHWGLVSNTIAAGFGLLVSVMALIKVPIEPNVGLPWYIQAYWATFNLTTPIALFITLFYWTLLTGVEQEFAINLTLDIFIHAVNSVLMCVLLICSRHPTYFFHVYIPIGYGIIYLVFSAIYYASGGTDAYGHHAIYPMLDWEKPGETIGIVLACVIGVTILHALTVGITIARDAVSRPLRKDNTLFNVNDSI